jgi:heme/copper-type cytochrome/quinol oxidase subunit 2
MAWWAWVLIAVAVIVIGYLKLKVWNSMAKKKPTQSEKNED